MFSNQHCKVLIDSHYAHATYRSLHHCEDAAGALSRYSKTDRESDSRMNHKAEILRQRTVLAVGDSKIYGEDAQHADMTMHKVEPNGVTRA